MFAELSRIMTFAVSNSSFAGSFKDNVTGKLSRSNQIKTNRYLKQLYGFNLSDPVFATFYWFWKNVPESELPLITLLYAICRDYLLAESIDAIKKVQTGSKVTIDDLMNSIEAQHQGHFSLTTLRSVAQNIASSWKQAGFIEGKVRNIKTEPEIGYYTVSFAVLLGYLENLRGEYLLQSKYIRTLNLERPKLLELISEAAKRDILSYQHSGNIITLNFNKLLKEIGIDGQ
jgi:hypothetical protein